MNNDRESIFHDIPIHDSSKNLFEKLLSTKEERSIIAQNLLNFYIKEHSLDFNLTQSLKDSYLNSIHLLLICFAYIIVIKEEEAFKQLCRRFIFESREDTKENFLMKKFFLTNFDSTEEYHIQSISSHQEIKKRTDILLQKYIQFFHYYL